MKKLAYSIVLFLCFSYIYSQELDYYYLEIKEGYELGEIQKTVNTDQTLALSMQNTDFASLLNSKQLYSFEKAFPTAQTPRLQRVYVVSLNKNTPVTDFSLKAEVQQFIAIDDEVIIEEENAVQNNNLFAAISLPPSPLPNDYDDIIEGGRNVMLDLIRAPQAWTVTTGNPNILVGVADASYDLNHEDLAGQIVDHIIINENNVSHGTGVASLIAARTNNNKGIASIGYNSKLVLATAYADSGSGINPVHQLINGLLQLSQYPGVKVINCSWGISQNSMLTLVMEEVTENGVLVIGAAGNSGTAYRYPASYDEAISVSSVGHKFPISNIDAIFGASNWKDCHENIPGNTNSSTHTHNDKVNICAPGWNVLRLKAGGGYNNIGAGTSLSTPIVSGVAALVFAANPNLTAMQVKNIIESTADDIYHIPYNQPYEGLLGTGRVNAYRAVLTAKCMDDPNYIGELDLMVRNSMIDYGVEPDNNTEQVFWHSQEIWVRHNSGESYIDVHQNPQHGSNNPNYVNVRVTNRSCVTSSGNEEITLYWAKANTALNWPNYWDGSLVMGDITDSNSQAPVGGVVGTLNIPSLEPGQEAIIEFEWQVPNPQDYYDINPNPWHFCLLARIESDDDPMTFPEGTHITHNVKNNNNIAWKNTTVIEIDPFTTTSKAVGGVVAVGNPFNETRTYTIEIVADAQNTPNEFGKMLHQEAEIGIEMNGGLYEAWQRGNKTGHHLKSTPFSNKVLADHTTTLIDNLQFEPNEYGTLYLSFNFLTKELSNKTNYTYHVIQRDKATGEIIGGETYEIRKQPRPTFAADAGNNKEIDRSESVTIQASEINEDAVYNWYDMDGNLIHTGSTLTVSPEFTQKYKLEVISDLDGLKDYAELEVKVNPYRIETLVPNPATSQVTVNYLATDATSAYVMVVHQNSGNTSNYIIDPQVNAHTIDLSNFASGLYSIILVCDGEIQGSKNLIKN